MHRTQRCAWRTCANVSLRYPPFDYSDRKRVKGVEKKSIFTLFRLCFRLFWASGPRGRELIFGLFFQVWAPKWPLLYSVAGPRNPNLRAWYQVRFLRRILGHSWVLVDGEEGTPGTVPLQNLRVTSHVLHQDVPLAWYRVRFFWIVLGHS